ncbi:unnamed protein product [Dovyalis caffra]|uniref:Uncharacterized protein n=1 Tax=Dovyalis caffra TaxID=77055 RepID=A0AAV1S1F0_9ROSI|nr:unnamed protein product [Dovyalis caffra]
MGTLSGGQGSRSQYGLQSFIYSVENHLECDKYIEARPTINKPVPKNKSNITSAAINGKNESTKARIVATNKDIVVVLTEDCEDDMEQTDQMAIISDTTEGPLMERVEPPDIPIEVEQVLLETLADEKLGFESMARALKEGQVFSCPTPND